MKIWRPKAAYQARKDGDWQAMIAEIDACQSHAEIDHWYDDYILNRARHMPEDWTPLFRDACDTRSEELAAIRAARMMDADYAATMRQ